MTKISQGGVGTGQCILTLSSILALLNLNQVLNKVDIAYYSPDPVKLI